MDECVLHYTSMGSDQIGDQAERVRGVQRFHMDTRGWSDIAYSFLYSDDGSIFEGRGWGVRTAATGPANGYSHAFCFLGADRDGRDDVTDAGREAVGSLILEAERRYGSQRVSGHRQHMGTSCPGDELMRYIASHAWEQSGAPSGAFRAMSKGDSGPRVKELQRRLDALSYVKLEADGQFGDLTVTAVKQLQRKAGIRATGKVGKPTWEALLAAVQ